VPHFAARQPEPGISPTAALRRVRRASLTIVAVTFVVAVASVVMLGYPTLVVVVASWCAAEVVVAQLCRYLDELGHVVEVLKRHTFYGMAACVAGVAFNAPTESIRAVILLVILGAVQIAASVLLPLPTFRRLIGIASPPSVLIVADRSTAAEVIKNRAKVTSSRVVGVCLTERAGIVSSVGGVPVLGGVDDVVSLVARLKIHEVAVRLETPLSGEWLRELLWSLEALGVRLTLVTNLRDTRARRVRVSCVGNSIVMCVSQSRPTGLVRHAKAAGETVLALVLFVLMLPLLLAFAVAIKLDSPGPALFRQTRVRDGDRTFRMLKLRTMTLDAEAHLAELEDSNDVGRGLFKMKEDPRVTRVGRVLRRLSLDELPQLLNVIRGEMSLIGPRPALPSEVERYDVRARHRLGVKPGMTGLWQVSGRSRLSWDESISLDIDYIDNWSPGRDVRIAVETIRAVAGKDGAY